MCRQYFGHVGVVLYEIFTVCLFITLWRGLDLGKCLLISWRNFFPTFVFTESEKGGLNIYLQCWFWLGKGAKKNSGIFH